MSTSIVFFGTHHFATHILTALIKDPSIEVKKVITQPDKPVGRKQILTKSPVKLLAEEHSILVEDPKSLQNFELEPGVYELGVTAQYGLIIPQHILDAPRMGMLNVHTSLLPKYRGASPIQSALIAGEEKTGVTIMKMDAGMDTGPILSQAEITIDPDDTYPDLDAKLAPVGAQLLLETIPNYLSGEVTPQAQDDATATKCKLFTREDGKIHWDSTTQEVYNRYRGLTPWPGIWTTLHAKRLKLLVIRPVQKDLAPGTLSLSENQVHIGTTDGAVKVTKLQPEGKKAVSGEDFARGYAAQYDGSVVGKQYVNSKKETENRKSRSTVHNIRI